MRSEFALFFSPRFVSFFWPWRCRGDGTVTVMPGHRETKRCWELVMKKWAQALEQKIYRLRSFWMASLGFSLDSWIFPWIPLDFPNLVPFGFRDFPGLGKTSQFGLGEANVDALSKNGSTPLLVASREGHTPVCKVWNPLNLESPSIHFFFGDQQIAVDGMISHSYKVKVLSHFLHSKSPLQVEFQSLGFLLPVSWELLGIDHLQWGMSNLHRCLRHGSHPRCLVFIRTLQAPSVRSEVRRHCWNMGQMPMMVVIRPARDFVLPECVSKKEDTTAAFWVTWGMVKVWYPTLCERAVNFYAFELLCCEFCAEATNLPFVLDSIWR